MARGSITIMPNGRTLSLAFTVDGQPVQAYTTARGDEQWSATPTINTVRTFYFRIGTTVHVSGTESSVERLGQDVTVTGEHLLQSSGAPPAPPSSGGGTGDVTSQQLADAVAVLQDKATAATDSELNAAVATINTALSGKQSSATAATDAELQAAVDALAAAAATDAELAAAVATINTALAGKMDALLGATDVEVESIRATLAALVATNTANIAANTAAIATKQDITADRGREIAGVIIDLGGGITAPDALENDIAGSSLLIPANSGAVELLVPSGLYVTGTTGTNLATVSQSVRVWIRDELNNLIAYGAWQFYGTGTSQILSQVMAMGQLVPNSGIDKTYRLRWQVQRQGTSGASGQMVSGGIFGKLNFRAVAR